MKIEVEYLFERDAINYLSSVYKFKWSKHGRKGLEDRIARYLPESFYNGVRKAKSENEVRQLIKEYLQNNYKVNLKLAKEVSNNLKKTWNLYGKKIEKELEVVFNEKFPFKKLNIYLTTIPISPYKYPDWILVYINLATEKQLNVIKHELNHFMFHHYYSYLEEEIGKDQFQSLKESLTVLTNPEERGYPTELKLREWLKLQKDSLHDIIKEETWKKFLVRK